MKRHIRKTLSILTFPLFSIVLFTSSSFAQKSDNAHQQLVAKSDAIPLCCIDAACSSKKEVVHPKTSNTENFGRTSWLGASKWDRHRMSSGKKNTEPNSSYTSHAKTKKDYGKYSWLQISKRNHGKFNR